MSQIQIPKGWLKKDLADVLDVLENGNRPKGGVSKMTDGVPSLGGEHLNDEGGFNFENIKHISEDFFKTLNKGVIKKYDILMVKDGYTGRTSFVDEKFPYHKATVSEHVFILRPNKEIIPKYLYYFLKSNYAQLIIKNKTKGIIAGINKQFVKDFSIIFPKDKKTQERIVQKLDNILMKLNKKLKIILETQDKQIQLSRKQKKKFYQHVLDNACFGKFTTDWKLKNSIESIPPRILELNDDKLVELSIRKQFPKEWVVVTLESISEIRSGATLGRSLQGDLISLPYLRVANVQDGYLDLRRIKQISIKPEEKEKWLLNKGDILLTEGGDWDKLGRGTVWEGQIKDCIHQNHIFRVRLNPEEFNPYFVSFVISSTYGKQYFQKSAKRTTNLASINSTQLKAFPMLCPTLSEQNEIVKIVNEKICSTKILEDKINEYMNLLGKSKNYIKQLSLSILDQTFSGKLVN